MSVELYLRGHRQSMGHCLVKMFRYTLSILTGAEVKVKDFKLSKQTK